MNLINILSKLRTRLTKLFSQLNPTKKKPQKQPYVIISPNGSYKNYLLDDVFSKKLITTDELDLIFEEVRKIKAGGDSGGIFLLRLISRMRSNNPNKDNPLAEKYIDIIGDFYVDYDEHYFIVKKSFLNEMQKLQNLA